jgi:hypothetical protein
MVHHYQRIEIAFLHLKFGIVIRELSSGDAAVPHAPKKALCVRRVESRAEMGTASGASGGCGRTEITIPASATIHDPVRRPRAGVFTTRAIKKSHKTSAYRPIRLMAYPSTRNNTHLRRLRGVTDDTNIFIGRKRRPSRKLGRPP